MFVLTGTQTEKGVALPWLTHETKRKQVTKGKGKWGKQGERLWLEACYLLVQNGLIKCWSYLYICTSLFIWKPYICFILLNLPYIYELCLTLYLFWFVFIYLCIFMYLGFFFKVWVLQKSWRDFLLHIINLSRKNRELYTERPCMESNPEPAW